jgi:hypothetical protein
MCTNIINKFDNIVFVGVIDKDTRLLVGKSKDIENDIVVAGVTYQSQFPETYEIYNVLKNINNKLSHLKSEDFGYVIITKNKFKLIVIPLLPNRTKYICIFIIVSNKAIKNLISKILEFVI